MSARALAWLLTAAAATLRPAAATAASAASPPLAETAAVRVEHRPGVTGLFARVSGQILSVATPSAAGGAGRVILLVAPEGEAHKRMPEGTAATPHANAGKDPPEDPCANPDQRSDEPRDTQPRLLMQLDTAGEGALRTLRSDLPADVRELLAADVNADGREDLVLARSKSLSVLIDEGGSAWSGSLETVVTFSEDATSPRIGAAPTGTDGASLWMIDLGAVRTFARNGDGSWRELPRIPVPVTAAKKDAALVLTGVRIGPLDANDPRSPLATGPESLGGDRLRTLVIRPGAEEERRAEVWSHLPSAEKLLETAYLKLADTFALFVTTRPADKLSLFGEKLVRVFPLVSDRTRKGRAPLAAFESGANLWQQIHPSLTDVNGDGRQDLVVAYWKGLKDDTVVFEVFLANAEGTFETKARTTEFDVENAERGVLEYGEDLDGAGLPDLILSANGEIQCYPGAAAPDAGRHIVASRPSWSIPLPGPTHRDRQIEVSVGSEGFDAESSGDFEWSLRPLDLDGNGRLQLLCAPRSGTSSDTLAILRPDSR